MTSMKSNKLFLDNLEHLLKTHGLHKAKMLRDLGLSRNAFINWEQRGNIPSGEILKKIADYFNVSVDELLGNEQKEKPHTEIGIELSLSDDELVLLKKYRSLPPEEKKVVLRAAGATINHKDQ